MIKPIIKFDIAGIVVASVLSIFMLTNLIDVTKDLFQNKEIVQSTIIAFAHIIASAIFAVLIFYSTIW